MRYCHHHPIYPEAAILQGLQGIVELEYDVLSTSHTANIKVVSSPDPLFEAPAKSYVESCKYFPALKYGAPIDTIGVRWRMTFTLED